MGAEMTLATPLPPAKVVAARGMRMPVVVPARLRLSVAPAVLPDTPLVD